MSTAEFAPILPISLLRRIQRIDMLGQYNLVLAHDVLSKGTDYKEVFDKHYKQHSDGATTTILDNSVIELGESLDYSDLAHAADVVHATYVILPDVLWDRRATVRASQIAAHEFEKAHVGFKFMGVPQGTTLEEYVDCANTLIDQCGVSALAVPKRVRKVLRTRQQLVSSLISLGVPIHLLGMTDDLTDDLYSASLPRVTGMDSAVPVWLGIQDRLLRVPPSSHLDHNGGRPKDFLDYGGPLTTTIMANILIVRRWLQNGGV